MGTRYSRARPDRLLFPAALLLALIAVPLKAVQVAGAAAFDFLPPFWHGHEMLMGYAYAVIGGYLMTGRPRRALPLAFAAWLAGRLAILLAQAPLPPILWMAALLAYPALLFLLAGLPMARAGKAGRNMVFPLLLAGMAVAEGLYVLGAAGIFADGGRRGLSLAAAMVLLLLFTMGGRIIAAASSGAHRDRGAPPRRYAQPRLEAAGIATIALAGTLDVAGLPGPLSAAASLAAGLVILIRLAGWRPWHLAARPEVFFLHLGYGWLALGFLIKAWAQTTGVWPALSALHVAFVGGLGMLSLAMMARVRLQRDRHALRFPAAVRLSLTLVAGAALARAVALLPAPGAAALWISATLWCGGIIAMLLFQILPPPARTVHVR